ncbi:P-loop containing nucleoside triphosphate hydrolase protein [Penicillium sp. IBT 18751x]|nr:P-loop containing nucleoside triphosphate hydrolase protein [Penicillium sp. IBT 18751x]
MEAATLEAAILCFLCEVGKLKLTEREGWKRTIPNPECVAAHSHRMALMTMLIPDDRGLDKFKCIKMAVVHDLAESIIGDVPSFAELPKSEHPSHVVHLLELWLEYERDETEEAKAVREIDKTECLIQAWQYERSTFGEKDLEEFQGLRKKIHSKEGKALVEALSQERERDCARRAQRLPILFIMGGCPARNRTSTI